MGNVPSSCASRASTVAIFAARMIDGAGRPAARRSDMRTSSGQPRFSALVIMISHIRPCAASILSAAMTSAGRRCRTGRSVYGNGTLTMSHTSKIAIGAPVGLGRPLMESSEGIVDRFPLCLGQDYVVTFDPISDLIALAHTEGGTDRLRDRCLGLAGNLARDHDLSQDVCAT